MKPAPRQPDLTAGRTCHLHDGLTGGTKGCSSPLEAGIEAAARERRDAICGVCHRALDRGEIPEAIAEPGVFFPTPRDHAVSGWC